MSAGTIFIELDLDPRKYKGKMAELQASASKASTHLETNWKRLGGVSDEVFSIMRKSSQNTYEAIVKHAGVSLNAKLRAHQTHNAELDKLNRQQYLWQESTYQKLGITSQAMYAQMRTDAYSAYAAIATAAGQGSADEIAAGIARNATLQALRVQQIAQSRMAATEMQKNFSILGIQSTATIRQMKADTIMAYRAIRVVHEKGSADRIRSQEAMYARLKALDDQQAGRMAGNITKIKLGWMEMVKGAIVFRLAMGAIHLLYEATIGSFKRGIAAIEEMKQSSIALASAFATNDPSLPFERSKRIADGVVEKIQEMDRAFVGTAKELTTLIDAWATYGGAVDLSTKKAQDQFVVFANIVKLMTRGQDFQRQAMQEVRALMEGSNVQGAMIVKKLAAMGVNTKVMIPLWREQGTLLENIIKILPGYVEGSKEIEKTLTAQAATLSTIAYKLLREAMAPAYKDIVGLVTSINDYLIEQKGVVTFIQVAWEGVKVIAEVIGTIFKGWILILGEVLGLVERIGETMERASDRGAAMGDLGLGLVGDPEGWEKAGEANAMAYLFGMGILIRAGTSETMQSLEAERDKLFADLLLKTKPGPGKKDDAASKALAKLKEQWVEMKRTLEGKIEGEGLDDFQKKLISIRLEAEKLAERFKGIAGADMTIAKWQEGAEAQAAGEAFTKDEEAYAKREAAFQKAIDKETEATIKAQDDYKKLVTEANDWAVSERDRAINKIISKETESIDTLYGLFDIGKISAEQFQEGMLAVWAATDDAMEARRIKDLKREAEFYSEITGYEEEYRERTLKLIEQERKERERLYKDPVAAAKWAAEQIGKLDQKMFEDKAKKLHSAFGDMASAFASISTMYDENSDEYAKMQESAKAMIVLQQAVAVANAVAAIANQGLGDPYTAFARIAAMAATMGSLLATINSSVAGGVGGGTAPVLAPSTILGGEPGEASESIAKSLKLLEDTYELEYYTLHGIYQSMKDLNKNITGLVVSILRGGKGFGVGGTSYSPGFAEDLSSDLVGIHVKAFNILTFGLLGGLGDKIGGLVDDLLGGAISSIFGGGTTTSVTGGGIFIGGGGLAGAGFRAQQYTDISQQTKGGWFHSDTNREFTEFTQLDPGVKRMITLVFDNLSDTLVLLSEGLGRDTEAALNYIFEDIRINLIGLSSDEINQALMEAFSEVADIAVGDLFGDLLLQFQKLNETLLETAIRVVTELEVVNGLLKDVNQQAPDTIPFATLKEDIQALFDAREGIFTQFADNQKAILQVYRNADELFYRWKVFEGGPRSVPRGEPYDPYQVLSEGIFEDATSQLISFTEAIIELAGGLENLSKYATTYYDKFFTDVEKQARLQTQLTDILGDMNLVLPETRMGYRDLVEGLDLSTEAGQQAFVTLLRLAGAADEYYSTLEDGIDTYKDLQKQIEMIDDWINSLKFSSLAPVTSEQSRTEEYERLKTLAMGEGATTDDVKDFLNYTKDYLTFMRAFSGDYLDVYNAVIEDVEELREVKNIALQQLEELERIRIAVENEPPPEPLPFPSPDLPRVIDDLGYFATGGLTSGRSMAGESGPEWIVPTYEPERSNFLRSVPQQFWENLGGGGSGGGDITIRVPVYLDGKLVAENVAKHIPRNANLADAIKRTVS